MAAEEEEEITSQETEEVAVEVAMAESTAKTEVRAVEAIAEVVEIEEIAAEVVAAEIAAAEVVEIAKMERIAVEAVDVEEEIVEMENMEAVEEVAVRVAKESEVKVSMMKQAILTLQKLADTVKDIVARLVKNGILWIALPEPVVEEATGKSKVVVAVTGVTIRSLLKVKRKRKEMVRMPMKKARVKDVKEDHAERKRRLKKKKKSDSLMTTSSLNSK